MLLLSNINRKTNYMGSPAMPSDLTLSQGHSDFEDIYREGAELGRLLLIKH